MTADQWRSIGQIIMGVCGVIGAAVLALEPEPGYRVGAVLIAALAGALITASAYDVLQADSGPSGATE